MCWPIFNKLMIAKVQDQNYESVPLFNAICSHLEVATVKLVLYMTLRLMYDNVWCFDILPSLSALHANRSFVSTEIWNLERLRQKILQCTLQVKTFLFLIYNIAAKRQINKKNFIVMQFKYYPNTKTLNIPTFI